MFFHRKKQANELISLLLMKLLIQENWGFVLSFPKLLMFLEIMSLVFRTLEFLRQFCRILMVLEDEFL